MAMCVGLKVQLQLKHIASTNLLYLMFLILVAVNAVYEKYSWLYDEKRQRQSTICFASDLPEPWAWAMSHKPLRNGHLWK